MAQKKWEGFDGVLTQLSSAYRALLVELRGRLLCVEVGLAKFLVNICTKFSCRLDIV